MNPKFTLRNQVVFTNLQNVEVFFNVKKNSLFYLIKQNTVYKIRVQLFLLYIEPKMLIIKF